MREVRALWQQLAAGVQDGLSEIRRDLNLINKTREAEEQQEEPEFRLGSENLDNLIFRHCRGPIVRPPVGN